MNSHDVVEAIHWLGTGMVIVVGSAAVMIILQLLNILDQLKKLVADREEKGERG